MHGLSVLPLLVSLLLSAAGIAVLMLVTLALSLRARSWSIIDTFWGLGFVVVAGVSYLVSAGHGDPTRRLLALVVPTVWGLRLAAHIHWRNHGKPEDPRYTSHMRRRSGPLIPYVLRTLFWAQGWVMWVVSLPIQVAMYEHSRVNALTWAGVALACVGVFFEAVGDLQLAAFKADPANEGKILDRGLWAWTRHPNYFGDVCVMFSFWLIAGGHWLGVLTIFAPVLMTHTLLTKTGKSMLERRMARKRGAAFEQYVAITSAFLPRPPRRRGSLAGR